MLLLGSCDHQGIDRDGTAAPEDHRIDIDRLQPIAGGKREPLQRAQEFDERVAAALIIPARAREDASQCARSN